MKTERELYFCWKIKRFSTKSRVLFYGASGLRGPDYAGLAPPSAPRPNLRNLTAKKQSISLKGSRHWLVTVNFTRQKKRPSKRSIRKTPQKLGFSMNFYLYSPTGLPSIASYKRFLKAGHKPTGYDIKRT